MTLLLLAGRRRWPGSWKPLLVFDAARGGVTRQVQLYAPVAHGPALLHALGSVAPGGWQVSVHTVLYGLTVVHVPQVHTYWGSQYAQPGARNPRNVHPAPWCCVG